MRKWLKKGKPLFAALLVMSILIQNISVFASETSEEQPVVYVNGTNGKDTADGSIYRPVKTLSEAYKRLADTGGIITISGEITNEDKMSISSTELIVNDESHKINNGGKIKITRKTNQYMITNRNELTISDITIDGASDAKSYMIKNAAGTLTINDGAILINAQKGCIGNFADLVMNGGEITNNYTNMSWYGAGIHNTETGHVIINGGKISNNTGDIYIYATNVNAVGAGITNFGTLDFYGGTISGNTVNYAGAGIYNGGIMNMSGGSVIDNVIIQNDFIDVGESYGAGIANSGTLNISGGTISGNSTDADSDKAQKIYGALYNKASGTATITGGTISGNEVANGGGIYNDGNMTIENVSVKQNTAIGSGGGIHNNGELTITGGVVSDNVSETDTGNGIFQNGIMNMRDNAVINTNNDIYIVKPITIQAQLNPTTEIYGRLTPSEYIFNRVVVNVEYDSTLGSEVLYDGKNTKKWELTPRESWKLEATDLLLDVDTDNQIVLRQIGKNVIKFVAGEHGSLNGESKFIVDEGSSFYQKVTVPMPQANEGYQFTGWTPQLPEEGTTITEDMLFTADFDNNKHTVTFVDGLTEETISTTEVEHGGDVTPPDAPSHEGYEFTGWDGNVKNIIEDGIVTAIYKEIPKAQYTITFQDWDGTIITQDVYEEGSTIVIPADPTRPADDSFTYEFAGWSPNVSTTATADATYMATYTATAIPKEYTITFQDWDGSIIAQDVYEEGSTIVIPADPTRPADDSFTYEFAGWSPNVSTTATADATYMATYTATAIPEPVPDKYTITFVDWNGKIISKEVYEEGSTITVPGNPSRPADSNFTYEFAGWQPSVSTIATADATYTATYKATPIPTPKEYKISFVDWNGKVISEKVYKEGAIIAIPENPSRPADSNFIYEFAGWQPSVSTIATADATYTATYKATPIPPKPVEKFTIKFVAGEHGSLDGQTEFILEKGTPFYYGVTIPKTMADTGYHFVGWTPVLPDTMALVTGNMTFQANFAINAYTITYLDGVNDSIIGKVEVEHGGNVTPPDAPQHEGYEFTGWDGNVKNITEDGVVTATYKAIEKPPVDPEDPEIPLTPLEPATPVEKPEKPETPDEKPETPKTEDPEKPTVETTEEVKTGNNLPLAGMSVILMTSIIGAIFITKKMKKD